MRRVFVCFLEEIEDSKKAFRNYLTFSDNIMFSFIKQLFMELTYDLLSAKPAPW